MITIVPDPTYDKQHLVLWKGKRFGIIEEATYASVDDPIQFDFHDDEFGFRHHSSTLDECLSKIRESFANPYVVSEVERR
jgi:hypothetical protein